MSRTRTLVALLCAAVAAIAPAAAQAAVTTTTIDYGPYTIPAGNGDPHDHMGMGMIQNQIVTNVAKPCSGCTIVKIKPDLVYTNGTKANIADGPMLHHALFGALGGGKSDATCAGTTVGQLGERFFASGNERTTMDVSSVPYGYKVGTSESWNMVFDLMNWQTTSKTVKIRMTYTYATGADATARAALRPVWLDVAQCTMNSYFAVPNGISDTHYDWNVSVPGKLIHALGHIHDHGVNVQLTNESTGGTNLCNSVATAGGTPDYVTPDGRGHISNMTTCLGNPISTLARNQKLRLHVNYNVPATHHPIDDAMGIMIAYLG
jgi:hypothetical protein